VQFQFQNQTHCITYMLFFFGDISLLSLPYRSAVMASRWPVVEVLCLMAVVAPCRGATSVPQDGDED
jgi:hypothetical protein